MMKNMGVVRIQLSSAGQEVTELFQCTMRLRSDGVSIKHDNYSTLKYVRL